MKTTILVTGRNFVGKGFRAIEPVIEEIIASAKSEIHLIAYLITESAFPFLESLEIALQRGISVTMVLNKIEEQPQKIVHWINIQHNKFPHFHAYSFEDDAGQLHAKVLITDRNKALIGSANFTWRGMFSNHEVAVLVEGSDVWTLASLIDSFNKTKYPAN